MVIQATSCIFLLSVLYLLSSSSLHLPLCSPGLELCDPPHRLMVEMVSGFFAIAAELLLPGLAVLCRDWPVLQAVATLPLLLLLSYWW